MNIKNDNLLSLFDSNDINDIKNHQPFTFIDLFAGIGGFHLALSDLNGQCVFASEKDKHAKQTYLENHGNHFIFNEDIRKIAPEDIPEHDILCAGFPCQPFSQAGHKKGFNDGENSERGNLFYCILDILEAKQPKAFILENVRHLVAHDEGRTFKIILECLDKANYQIYYKIIKASDFNVPQHRARVFIVGFNRSKINTQPRFNFPMPVQLTRTMSHIFNAPCEKEIGFTLRVGGKGSPIEDRRNYEFYRVEGAVRRINLVEAQALMSFPKTFKFPVSNAQAMKQLGNSVCVEVVKAVANSVLNYLNVNTIDINTNNNQETIMQNKGEISETYALLKIIHQKIIQYGDKHGYPTDNSMRVINIKPNPLTLISLGDISITILINNKNNIQLTPSTAQLISISDFITESELSQIIKEIKQNKGTFDLQKINYARNLLNISKNKGSSKEKSDIILDFQDSIFNENQGISIKSFLGNAPTLLNASSATNFIYEIIDLNLKAHLLSIDSINSIEGSSKIKDRVSCIINQGGGFKFVECENKTYESNLRKADSLMPEILADALLQYYSNQSNKFLSDYIPINLNHMSVDNVRCRLQDFIKYTVFGIFPATPWDGQISANGALLVSNTGDLTFYHTNQENVLKDYFYQKAYFDTPSSSRHRFGTLYKENGKLLFKLNLQLRLY